MKAKNYTYVIKLYSNGDNIAEYRWDEMFSPPDEGQKNLNRIGVMDTYHVIDKAELHVSTSDGDVLNFTYQK